MTSAPNAGDALSLVRLAASGAASALALHASRIDDINVFPVPDGDTGANLSQTARSVVEALQANRARALGDRARRRARRSWAPAATPASSSRSSCAGSATASARAARSTATRSPMRCGGRAPRPTPRCASRSRAPS